MCIGDKEIKLVHLIYHMYPKNGDIKLRVLKYNLLVDILFAICDLSVQSYSVVRNMSVIMIYVFWNNLVDIAFDWKSSFY